MKGERDATVRGRSAFVIAPADFDVDVLVKRSRQSVTWGGQHPPATSSLRRVHHGTGIGRVTQPEYRKGFQASIEQHDPRRRATLCGVVRRRGAGIPTEHDQPSRMTWPFNGPAAFEESQRTQAATVSRSTYFWS